MSKFFKLKRDNNNYNIFSKKPFTKCYSINKDIVSDSFEFAYNMTFGKSEGHRSDVSMIQNQGEIFANAFHGKLSEVAFYEMASSHSIKLSEPDVEANNLETYDSYDFMINNKKIAIMSTKYYGNLLLLETKDWNKNGEYVPNISSGTSLYDYFVLVRLKPSTDNILRKKKFFLTDEFEKADLRNLIMDENWEYDFLGYVTIEDLKYIINQKFVLPKNSMLNGKTKMDADNYYIQGNNMRNIEELFREF